MLHSVSIPGTEDADGSATIVVNTKELGSETQNDAFSAVNELFMTYKESAVTQEKHAVPQSTTISV